MDKCDACGNVYDKSFQVIAAGKTYTFDSFECAIHTLAPTCAHCGVRIVGHGPDETIRAAALQMLNGNFGMLPVGENDRMIGTISDRDIAIRAVADGKGADTKVREIMSEGIVWAYEDDSVGDAAKLMS